MNGKPLMESNHFLEEDSSRAPAFRDYLVTTMRIAKEQADGYIPVNAETQNRAREACLTAAIIMFRAENSPNFEVAASTFKSNPELGGLVMYWARNITEGVRKGDNEVIAWLTSFTSQRRNPDIKPPELLLRKLFVERMIDEFNPPLGKARITLAVGATMLEGCLQSVAFVRPTDHYDGLLQQAEELQGFSSQRHPPDLAFKNAKKV